MFLRSQSASPFGAPLMDPAQPVMPRSPYLTPAMRGEMGVPFPGAIMGSELSPSFAPAEAAPAPEPPRMPRSLPETTAGGFASGFTPASLALPRQVERGRGPFADFMDTYNATRTPPPQDPFAFMQPPPEQAPRAMPQVANGTPRQQPQVDPQQMAREAHFAQRYPRAMNRIQQLRARSQQRGY